jgi:5'-deoxynucleotidase YfbR-like HD superfamily hydrolase
MIDKKPDAVIDELLNITSGYGNTLRASIDPFTHARHSAGEESELMRESLMFHIGHLTTVAVALFPYLENPQVSIGKTLTMLAVHDIGETVTGDKMIFTKTAADALVEDELAYKMLEGELLQALKDFNELSDDSARFAKSCDKLVADLLELILPSKLSLARYAQTSGLNTPEEIIAAKRNKKMQYMQWNPFLAEMYERLLQKLQAHFEA